MKFNMISIFYIFQKTNLIKFMLSVIIPVFNEKNTILKIIEKLKI